MNRKLSEPTIIRTFVLVCLLSAASVCRAQALKAKTPYPNMAPVDRYLMADRNAEIALARSAAPAAISSHATVLVLGRHGYQTAIQGKNGFVCVVERSWMSPFNSPKFWNPRLRGPICFNPPAARSILPFTIKRTELILAGRSKPQVIAAIQSAIEKKELPSLEPGGMCYMMSKQAYLGDSVGPWVSHLMFYVPQTGAATWGADVPDSPVMMSSQFQGAPEPVTVFMVPVGNWSDGTPVASASTQKH